MTTLRSIPLQGALLVALAASALIAVGIAHAQTAPPTRPTLGTELSVGSTGPNVTLLQQYLATDPSVYPQGIVSGYYGPLTKNAVAQFQIGYGLPPVGAVGPQTLAKLNAMLAAGTPLDVDAPIVSIVNVATTTSSATITWTTNEPTFGSVNYATAPISFEEVSTAHEEPVTSGTRVTDSVYGSAHSVTLTGLTSGTIYYVSTESRDATGNLTVTLSQPITF